ncbi:MAG: transporter substrate-binding domain-containing protein [Chlamydiales bacterium]|nr:transporter substrate-binding domain-containing protein [Chlamydiales bacterium]
MNRFRPLSKLHLLVKIGLFGIFDTKFFDHVFTHALKILRQICTKNLNFSEQSEFRKRSILALLLFAASCLHAQENPPLRVGMELSYYPFESVDDQGKPWGVSVDLAKALGAYLGREVEIVGTPFVGLIFALKSKKIDLIISSMSVTPEREKAIGFSSPYLETGLCALISKKTAASSIDGLDLTGNKIAVKMGTTGEVFARKYFKQAQVIALDRESSCVLEVVQAKCNAFLYDQFSILAEWQKYPEATKANLNPFVKEYWAMGMRLEDTQLKAQANSFLKEFKESGGFQKLADKFFKEQQKLFAEQGVPFVFDIKG